MVRSLKDKHPNYFEATLQLRDITEEVREFVEKEIAKHKIPVAKVAKVKNGYDYFLADNSFTQGLGKKLQKRFGGQLVNTATLHTKQDNKELYRCTVMFRLPQFKKGDAVNYQGENYIVKLVAKETLIQHCKTGKKVRVKWKAMKEISKTIIDA
jgi:nonsense-mediated mRNA decay protein 3